jgi:hypothetical protein
VLKATKTSAWHLESVLFTACCPASVLPEVPNTFRENLVNFRIE